MSGAGSITAIAITANTGTSGVEMSKCGIDAFEAEAGEGSFENVETWKHNDISILDEEDAADFELFARSRHFFGKANRARGGRQWTVGIMYRSPELSCHFWTSQYGASTLELLIQGQKDSLHEWENISKDHHPHVDEMRYKSLVWNRAHCVIQAEEASMQKIFKIANDDARISFLNTALDVD